MSLGRARRAWEAGEPLEIGDVQPHSSDDGLRIGVTLPVGEVAPALEVLSEPLAGALGVLEGWFRASTPVSST